MSKLGTEEACSSQKRPSNTSKHEFFLLLWVIFVLLDPDPLSRLNTDPIRIRIRNPGRTQAASTGSKEIKYATRDEEAYSNNTKTTAGSNVADPDPQDPYVIGRPGSGSGTISPSIIKQK
jgi:hypothetical protein